MDIDSIDGGGLIVMGRQNLARIDRDGTVVYRRFFPAPPPSYWDFAASVLSAVAGGVSHTYASLPLPDYAWSAKARDYYYIFTAKADSAGKTGFSLVALDRKDGRELGRMWF